MFDKITNLLSERVEVGPGWLNNQFTMLSEKPPFIEEKIWKTLFSATQAGLKIKIWYNNPGYEQGLVQTVAPHHIICHDVQ